MFLLFMQEESDSVCLYVFLLRYKLGSVYGHQKDGQKEKLHKGKFKGEMRQI